VTDEVESFSTDAEIEVPWPVLHITGVRVDDSAPANDDGKLDPGERAFLEIELTNVGDEGTGALSCTLSQVGGTATATVHSGVTYFAPLSSGETKEKSFEVEVTAGSMGDDLQLQLDCTDNSAAYQAPLVLELGEAPWILLDPMDDAPDDALGGYDFDIVNGRYRNSGSTLQIVLTSATPYNPSTLFVESWMQSLGADYLYYHLVAQSGIGTLRGYKYAYTDLDDPTVTTLDDYSVLIEIDTSTMGLTLDRVDAGFGSGFCGGADFYCDHFPDGWGSLSSGFDERLWVTLDWAGTN
jgi:hypothetical protein